jgi:hypothetical protein
MVYQVWETNDSHQACHNAQIKAIFLAGDFALENLLYKVKSTKVTEEVNEVDVEA